MNMHLVVLLAACFAIGALGVAQVASNQDAIAARKSWTKYFSYLVIVAALVSVLMFAPRYFILPALLIVLAGTLEILRGVAGNWRKRFWVLLCYLCIAGLFLSCIPLCTSSEALLCLYTTIVLFDGFSQLCGQLLKGPRLAPKISPDKRLSGAVGGALLAILLMGLAQSILPLRVLILIVEAALCGDLLASYIKRRWGIKDYSNLIPGHGGVLDRFDSLLFAAAIFQLCCILNTVLCPV
jgi:phosphatidate cytidylyltransferase